MKLNIIRASGNPVDPEMEAEHKAAWQEGFDKLTEEHGKHGPAINDALDEFERFLSNKYNHLTVDQVKFPRSKKAWLELCMKYGNVMITTAVEDNEHMKSGDLLLVINDQMF